MPKRMRPACNCPPESPFMWAHNPRPSFAMSDKSMRTQENGMSSAQTAAKTVVAHGEKMHTKLYGLAHDRVKDAERMARSAAMRVRLRAVRDTANT